MIAEVFAAASINVLFLLAAEAALAKAGCKKHLRGAAAVTAICLLTGLECVSSRALPISQAIPAFVMTACFGACVVTDIISGLILDAITLPTLSATVLLASTSSRLAACAEGTLYCSLLFLTLYIASRGRGIGLGDAKLGACIGAFLGPLYGAEAIGLAFIIGGAIAAAVLLWRRAAWNTAVPFAPFLAAGALGVVVFNHS